ncbi:MAG: carbohydrate kinase family protein [Minisyncoccia bacterium]
MDIITIGGASRDITFITDKGKVIETPENLTEQKLLAFEYGAKINCDEVRYNFGGGACNTATTLAKLGINVAVNCKVGDDDEGRAMIKNLKKIGVKTGLVQVDKEERTGLSLVVVNKNGGDRVIFRHKGASEFLEVKYEGLIGKSKWIYLTSLAGSGKESLEEIKKIIEKKGIKLAWNPGGAQIGTGKKGLEEFFKVTEVLIINKDEAIEFVESDEKIKLDYNQINDPAVLSKTIKKWGPKIVAITDGENGAYVYDGGEHVLFAPATTNRGIDTTGAGDAFGSAMVGGYMLTDKLEDALKFGVLNSGNVVSEYGAQNGILDRAEIEKKLNSVKVSCL